MFNTKIRGAQLQLATLSRALIDPSLEADLSGIENNVTVIANTMATTVMIDTKFLDHKLEADPHIQYAKIMIVEYNDRNNLRSITPSYSEFIFVKDLGLFVWELNSVELDDDESSFTTTTGAWLLQAPSWDLINTWQSIGDSVRDEFNENEPVRFAAAFASAFAAVFASAFTASYNKKILTGSANNYILSLTSVNSIIFTGIVIGAEVGDRVIANPPGALGEDSLSTARLSYHAWVSAPDTISIMLTNASATLATTNNAIQSAWPITVIKT